MIIVFKLINTIAIFAFVFRCTAMRYETCEDLQESSFRKGNYKRKSLTYYGNLKLVCNGQNKLGAKASEYKIIWYHNCRKMHEGRTFKKRVVDFYDAGNYTCVALHKGKEIVKDHYSVCIKQYLDIWKYRNVFSLNCTEKALVSKRGETVHLLCRAAIMGGVIKLGELEVYWKNPNSDEILCRNTRFNTEEKLNEKYSCAVRGRNESIRCEDARLGYQHLGEILQYPTESIVIELFIKDLNFKDFATNHILTINHRNLTATSSVSLERGWNSYLMLIVNYLTIILPCVFIIAVCVIAIWYFDIELQVLFKRIYATKVGFVCDNKKHGIYLFYNYTGDPQDIENENLKKICPIIRKTSCQLGYSIFEEEQICVRGDTRIELLTSSIKKSHCAVVIVTSNFLENNWALFQADASIDCKTMIIFVFTPGSQKLFNNKATKNIARVARVSCTINWNDKMTDRELSKLIQNALPKLRQNNRVGVHVPTQCYTSRVDAIQHAAHA